MDVATSQGTKTVGILWIPRKLAAPIADDTHTHVDIRLSPIRR